jgi:hypothetical protein
VIIKQDEILSVELFLVMMNWRPSGGAAPCLLGVYVEKTSCQGEGEGQTVVHANVTLAVKGGRKASTFPFVTKMPYGRSKFPVFSH